MRDFFTSKTDKIFEVIVLVVLAIILIVEFYPLYFVVIASISDPKLVATNAISLYPKDITFEGYKIVMENKDIWTGFLNSFLYTVVGTIFNLFFTLTTAFCMARQPEFKGKGFIMGLFVFTMYFGGGLIPYYLLINEMGMINTFWVMVIPGALSVYNMIIARTYFTSSIPQSLYESARIDGAHDLQMFIKVTLPLAKPIIAVLSLFFIVGHWNTYFDAMLFLTDSDKYPLQLVLRNILILNQSLSTMSFSNMTAEEILDLVRRQELAESIKYAVIIISSLPMLVIYPFVQKYFVSGIMIGAIKG